MAKIGNRLYDYYVIRYGCFLKNIRFEEYDVSFVIFRSMRSGVPSTGSGLTTSTFSLTTRNTS